MSENKRAAKETAGGKRHSLWWLWVLLILAAFGGGIVVGLKLNTLPLPTEMRARLYPVLESVIPGSTAEQRPGMPVVSPAPETAKPEETAAPAAEETAAPAQEVVPAPAAEETAAPESTPAPAQTPEVFKMEDAAAFDAAENTADRQITAEKKYVGVSFALKTALAHAKVEEEDAEVSGVLRTKDEDGSPIYKVSFKSGEYDYEYVIDAVSGEVIGWEKTGYTYTESMTYAASFADEPVTEAEAAQAPEAGQPVKEKTGEER